MKKVEFMEGSEKFEEGHAAAWNELFRHCGVEEIVLLSTLKEMPLGIFDNCDALKTVWVAKGCQVDIRKYVKDSVDVRQK